jgi:hypothetical protein
MDDDALARARLKWALASDPELGEALRPLLEGAHGPATRRLVLECLAGRVAAGRSPRAALLPAVADALRIAGGRHDADSGPSLRVLGGP